MSKKEVSTLKKEIASINQGVSLAFKKVSEEFSEHLDTINMNSSEIETLTQTLIHLEQKIDKLNERIDELSMPKVESYMFPKKEYVLSTREQEVFLILYTNNKFLSTKDISKLVGRTVENTNEILLKLMSKDLPIEKQSVSSVVFYSLDKNFKRLQAKENIVKLHEHVVRELQVVNS